MLAHLKMFEPTFAMPCHHMRFVFLRAWLATAMILSASLLTTPPTSAPQFSPEWRISKLRQHCRLMTE